MSICDSVDADFLFDAFFRNTTRKYRRFLGNEWSWPTTSIDAKSTSCTCTGSYQPDNYKWFGLHIYNIM